jgi:hypothetical protein
MLSDCVISGLYMRVLKQTKEKLNSTNFFFSFLFFSVKRPDGLSWSLDGWSLVVRTGSGYVWTRAEPNGRTIKIDVRMRATSLHGSEAARVQTALIHRPDGDPTDAIYTLVRRISLIPHHNLFFCPLVSKFLRAFGIISSLLVFLCILSHSRYFSSLFLFSLFIFKLLEF